VTFRKVPLDEGALDRPALASDAARASYQEERPKLQDARTDLELSASPTEC
jgi:hypothetical protein